MHLRYLYADIEVLSLNIDYHVLRCRCFFVRAWAAQPLLYLLLSVGRKIAVCTFHCKSIIARGSCSFKSIIALGSAAAAGGQGLHSRDIAAHNLLRRSIKCLTLRLLAAPASSAASSPGPPSGRASRLRSAVQPPERCPNGARTSIHIV
jgi:hypothetical protein